MTSIKRIEEYMKKLKKLIALTSLFALCTTQVQGQEMNYNNPEFTSYVYNDQDANNCGTCADDCAAYCDSGTATKWSAAIPVGAVVIAAVLIASNRSHHSKHSSGGGGGRKFRHHSSSSSSSMSHN